MEERIHGSTPYSAQPTPPPPPAGPRTVPLLQPGSRPTTNSRSGVLRLTSPEESDLGGPGMDLEPVQRGTSQGIRQTQDQRQIHIGFTTDEGVRRTHFGGPGSGGAGGPKHEQMELPSPGGEAPTATADTELALSLVDQTRPAFEMKTGYAKPLSEEHLLSLVSNDYSPSSKPTYSSSPQAYSQSMYSSQVTYTNQQPSSGGLLQAAYDHKRDQLLSQGHPISPKAAPSPPIRDASSNRYSVPLSSSPKPAIGGILGAAYDHRKDQMIKQGHPLGSPLNVDINYSHTAYSGTGASPLITPTSPGGTRYGISPRGNVSSKPPDFDVDMFIRELEETEYSPKGVQSGHSPNVNLNLTYRNPPTQLDSQGGHSPNANLSLNYRNPPTQLDWGTPKTPIEGSVHNLTNRLLSSMYTGDGAAGDYTCVKCGEAITGKRSGCTALNATYHLDCFVCVTCGKRLAGGSFYSVNGKAYCENDYFRSEWAFCGKCRTFLTIKPDVNRSINYVKDGKVHCLKCYRDTLEKCGGCHKPIMDKILRAGGKAYHPACFTCTVCGKCLDGIPFTVDSNNANHCVQCFHDKYAPRCAVCSQAIVPEEGQEESVRVVAMDKSFHVRCYKCEDCGLQLSSKKEGHGCYPLDEHLYCHKCSTTRIKNMS